MLTSVSRSLSSSAVISVGVGLLYRAYSCGADLNSPPLSTSVEGVLCEDYSRTFSGLF